MLHNKNQCKSLLDPISSKTLTQRLTRTDNNNSLYYHNLWEELQTRFQLQRSLVDRPKLIHTLALERPEDSLTLLEILRWLTKATLALWHQVLEASEASQEIRSVPTAVFSKVAILEVPWLDQELWVPVLAHSLLKVSLLSLDQTAYQWVVS